MQATGHIQHILPALLIAVSTLAAPECDLKSAAVTCMLPVAGVDVFCKHALHDGASCPEWLTVLAKMTQPGWQLAGHTEFKPPGWHQC
jgi:hypothetical protein